MKEISYLNRVCWLLPVTLALRSLRQGHQELKASSDTQFRGQPGVPEALPQTNQQKQIWKQEVYQICFLLIIRILI